MDALDASSSLSSLWKHDIFLSFRGEDTRYKFISHLYAALDRKKIKTYKDDVSLERGDEISPALLEAIEKSKISIVVFSENYASSSWCLSELVHILKCHQEKKQMIIPIFYEVDPSHVRKQEGSYGVAFLKHQERFKDKVEILQKWRFALTESANLSGWDSQAIRPESKLVEAIVEDVLRKLSRGPLSNVGFEGLIGIDKKIEEIKSLLSVCSPKVRIVGIWGMAGIGKTTLAQVIFHQLSSQFEACYFVPNVREEAEKGSLIKLRNKLLAELLKEENLKLGTPTFVPSFVKERLQRSKVLIVLDDVNHVEQLNTFIGDRDWFSCDSRIVITTRDASLLRDISADGMCEVRELDSREALQLFKLIAFRGNSPSTDYIQLSKNVVEYAGGVPLAIIVLGSHFRSLRSPSKNAWEEALEKLKVVPHRDIHNVLRISFDHGLDNTEKDIFLDIACFFKWRSRDSVENILNACGFFASIGIDALIDKSLITIIDNKLWMHDLLEEMGRKIVCEESKELGERSRLWIAEDAYQLLENNEGTAKTQGIFLDLSEIEEEIHLEPATFQKMRHLRLLKIYGSFSSGKLNLQQGLCYLPPSLRYLEWHEYPLKCLPCNFKPKNLVELYMPYSQLEELWGGVQDLNKLRTIDLRHSIHLTQILDLSHAPNLERINLAYCTGLRQVPLHILQNLNRLSDLDLSCCTELQSFPNGIDAASLRTLSLQGCSNLNTLPMTIAVSLVSLDLASTAIEYLPSSIGSLKNLSIFHLEDCTRLENIPGSMSQLDSLKYLTLSGCSILEKFPELPISIENLNVSGTSIKEVASSSIEHCFSLEFLTMSDCKSLECLPANLSTLRSLAYLALDGCSKLEKLPEILEPMEILENLDLRRTGIRQLPSSIGNLIGLKVLSMDECEKLELIPSSFSMLERLRDLMLSSCPKLDYFLLPSVLESLVLSNSNIIEIPESIIKGISQLRKLYIGNCKNLRSLPDLPLSLELLDASGCVSLEVVLNARRALTQEFWIDYHVTEETCDYLMFYDCMKLDKKERDNILTDFQLRVLRMAKQFVPSEDQIFRPTVQVCYPGNEIPKWFEHQKEGPNIDIKLPREWNNSNFLGFVVCAAWGDSYPDAMVLGLFCKLNLKTSQGEIHHFAWEFSDGYSDFQSTSNSCHLYMWYQPEDYGNCLNAEDVSFHFSFEEYDREVEKMVESSKCQVKKCGIHILYRQDLEKFGLTFINDQVLGLEKSDMDLEESDSDAIPGKAEPSGASRTNDSDTEETQPKRIKF